MYDLNLGYFFYVSVFPQVYDFISQRKDYKEIIKCNNLFYVYSCEPLHKCWKYLGFSNFILCGLSVEIIPMSLEARLQRDFCENFIITVKNSDK